MIISKTKSKKFPLMRKSAPLGSLFAVAVLGFLGACSQAPETSAEAGSEATPSATGESDKIQAIATVGMVRDIVANVGGDRVEVENLMGEGVDPHLYKPTRDDVLKLNDADAVFYVGLHLEGRMTDTFNTLKAKGKPVYAVTELIDPSYVIQEENEEYEGGMESDPHVWMDVAAWSKTVEAVANALSEMDPDHEETYQANAAAYQQELADLDAYGKSIIASVPEKQRYLVTAHDAFNYFGRAYGVDVVGVQGLSTESEAGVQDINRLVDLIVEKEIPAIFVETSVSDKNVRAIIEGAKARGWDVVIGGELYSDAMGETGTYTGTYLGMMDHNLTTITRALGGEAPEKGMDGKLAE